MEIWERNKYISRITSRFNKIKLAGEIYYIGTPTADQRGEAEDVFEEEYYRAIDYGLWEDEDVEEFLKYIEVFTKDDSDRLKRLEENIEDIKVKMFEMRIQLGELKKLRAALRSTEQEQGRLFSLRHSFDQFTAFGVASAARQRHILSCLICDAQKKYLNVEDASMLADRLMIKLNMDRLNESDFRELARTEPWKTLWAAQKHCGKHIFDCSPLELSDDQKNLLVWSTIYESIREHPDNLEDEIIEDDDLLDGWLIMQRRERDKTKLKNLGEVSNKKINDAPEQFRVVDSVEGAKKIFSINDDAAKRTFTQRMNAVKQYGEVAEADMPDTANQIQMQRNVLAAQALKNRTG